MIVAVFDPSDFTVALDVARDITSEVDEILIGICAVTFEPTTVAVIVSTRSVMLMAPFDATGE